MLTFLLGNFLNLVTKKKKLAKKKLVSLPLQLLLLKFGNFFHNFYKIQNNHIQFTKFLFCDKILKNHVRLTL